MIKRGQVSDSRTAGGTAHPTQTIRAAGYKELQEGSTLYEANQALTLLVLPIVV